jgi:hypothetical protein
MSATCKPATCTASFEHRATANAIEIGSDIPIRKIIDRHCEPPGRAFGAPDDRLREAIQSPCRGLWIASSASPPRKMWLTPSLTFQQSAMASPWRSWQQPCGNASVRMPPPIRHAMRPMTWQKWSARCWSAGSSDHAATPSILLDCARRAPNLLLREKACPRNGPWRRSEVLQEPRVQLDFGLKRPKGMPTSVPTPPQSSKVSSAAGRSPVGNWIAWRRE